MRSLEFPGCCGIGILCDFGHTRFTTKLHTPTLEEIEEFLKRRVEMYKKQKYSMLIATLNDEQYAVMGDLFKKKGFHIKCRNPHEYHNTEIIVLIKKL